MRKERVAATELVATQLFAAEQAVDVALAELSRLQAAIPKARMMAKLSAYAGQDALDDIAEAIVAITRTRRLTIEAHTHLDELKTSIGLRELALGGGMLKPLKGALLSVVESEAA